MPRPAHRITREQNAARWRRLVVDYQSSLLCQADFCTEHGITLSSFTRWRRRLADTSPTSAVTDAADPTVSSGFVAVRVTPVTSSIARSNSMLSIALPGGLRIENIEEANVPVVAALVAAL